MILSYTEEDVNEILEHLKQHPEDSEKWHRLGVAYLSMKNQDEAEKAFQQCLKLDKDNPFALGDLGALYITKGKAKKAIKSLEKSLKISPDKHEYWLALGVAYLQRNRVHLRIV
jgi:cytochrome c-type biogenesis protein CcmH/NrfG